MFFFINSIKNISSKIVQSSCNSTHFFQNHKIEKNRFYWKFTTAEEILSIVENMKNSSSLDIYDFSNAFVKQTIGLYLWPLTFCLNRCLEEGYFPNEFKLAKVIPIYKNGERSDPNNYRPISLIPTLAKVFEYILFRQVYNFFESNNFFSNSQFGFRCGRSTTDAIDEVVKNILTGFESNAFTWGTFCDLSKAFDCLSFDLILEKLEYYGICDSQINLFRSYFEGRKQSVCVRGEWSPVTEITCGVPQGSILGPLLFIIFINDLPANINSLSYMYADDTALLSIHSNINELKSLASSSIKDASEWFNSNHFLLNNKKTQSVIFTLKKVPEDIASDPKPVKYLGMMLDNKLSWSPHVDMVTKKISRVVFLLQRLLNFVPLKYVISSYFAFFQSVIRYGLVFYGLSSKTNDILLIQKKIVRIISKSPWKSHCRPLFRDLNILTVHNLFIFDTTLYILKNLDSFKLRENIHPHYTRSQLKIDVPYCRLRKTQSSHIISGIKFYNKLPKSAFKLPFNSFKSKFYNWLILNPFYSVDEFLSLKNEEIVF